VEPPEGIRRRNEVLVQGDGPLRVFVDDDFEHRRPRGDDWVHVATAGEAISLLETGRVTCLSLDHDLGSEEAGTGYDIVLHLETRLRRDGVDLWPTELIEVHSGNVVGALKIARGIDANTRLRRVPAAKPRWEAR
jgi:Cyclic-phosphate processing Receiver domain